MKRCKLLGLALVLLAGCKAKVETPPASPPEVLTMELEPRDVPLSREYVGSLDGLVSADIQARVSGYLISQDYKEGTALKKGDLLFQIDPRPFQAALAQAKASAAEATATQKKAALTADRDVELFTRNAISAQERDNAVQVKLAADAQVQSQAAQVQQAELNVEFTRITAPIDGIAGIAKVQVGALVGPSTGALTSISTVDPIKAYFTISEQRYVEVMRKYQGPGEREAHEKALQFQLVLADGTVFPQKGEFFATDRQVDPRTGALRVAATFPNPGNLLRPGQFARVRVQSEVRSGALLIPQRAVTELQGIYQVAVVDAQSKVSLRPVKLGDRIDSDWLVEQGLKPHEKIVVEGVQKVRDGGEVSAKPWVKPATR